MSSDDLFDVLYAEKHYIDRHYNIKPETRDVFFAEYPDFAAGLSSGKVKDRNKDKPKQVKIRKAVYKEIKELWETINRRYLLFYKDRLEQLESAKEELEIQIAKAELEHPPLTREQIECWFELMRHMDISDIEQKQLLIDTFINAVYVYDDHLLITFNCKEGSKTVSLAEADEAAGSDSARCAAPKLRNGLNKPFLSFFFCPESDDFQLRNHARSTMLSTKQKSRVFGVYAVGSWLTHLLRLNNFRAVLQKRIDIKV